MSLPRAIYDVSFQAFLCSTRNASGHLRLPSPVQNYFRVSIVKCQTSYSVLTAKIRVIGKSVAFATEYNGSLLKRNIGDTKSAVIAGHQKQVTLSLQPLSEYVLGK